MLIALLLTGMALAVGNAAEDPPPTAISLDGEWAFAPDADGQAAREAWAVQLPHPDTITIPHTWADTSPVPRVCWYSRLATFPAAGPAFRLVIRQPIGACEVYLDGALRARFWGNGLTHRVPLQAAPGAEHRITLRLDAGMLPDRPHVPPGLGSISLEALPACYVDTLLPRVDAGRKTCILHYRLVSQAEGPVGFRLELFAADARRALVRRALTIAMPAGPSEGEMSFPLKRMLHWTPEAPKYYRLRVTLTIGGQTSDVRDIPWGYCALDFLQHGMALDGAPVLLRGLRLSSDRLPRTRRINRDTLEAEMRLVRQAGFNALFVDAATLPDELPAITDRLGLMLIVEIPPGQPATKEEAGQPDILSAVEVFGCHPSLVAWSWPGSLQTAGTVADLRAADPTRLALIWNGADSRVFRPFSSESEPFIDLAGTVAMPQPEVWKTTLAQAETGNVPLLAGEIGIRVPDTASPVAPGNGSGLPDQAATAPDEQTFRRQEEMTLAEMRAMVEGVCRAQYPLGYFLSPLHDSLLTGLMTSEGTPSRLFVAAMACSQSYLVAMRPAPEISAGQPLALDAAIINDARKAGNYHLFLFIMAPDGRTSVRDLGPLALTGKRVQPLSHLSPLDKLNRPGEYHLRLALSDGTLVLAETQRTVHVLPNALENGPAPAHVAE